MGHLGRDGRCVVLGGARFQATDKPSLRPAPPAPVGQWHPPCHANRFAGAIPRVIPNARHFFFEEAIMMNPVIVPLKTEKRFLVTEELSLRFKLHCVEGDSLPEEHAALRILVFHSDNGWQGLRWARQIDGNLYQVTFPTPPAGDCYLFFSWPGTVEEVERLPYVVIQPASEAAATDTVCRFAPAVREC
jgi:hypothetical protein